MTSHLLRIIKTASIALALGLPAAAQSLPADSARVLAAYQGDWRGSGEARPTLRSDLTRITCRVSARFDPAEIALSNEGKCGTTKGTRDLKGTLSVENGELTGDFLSAAANQGLVSPRLRIVDDMIVSEAYVDDGGRMVKVRTFLTPPEDGAFRIQSQYFDRAANDWVVSGEIEFQRQ